LDTYNADEELEKLKSWWKSYGNSVIGGIVLGVALLGGITYWKHYKTERASQASMLYDKLIAGAAQNNATAAVDDGAKLISDYSATAYAGKAALILAKLSYDAADVEGARRHLQWAVDHATETATRQMARLRLARILIEQKALDQALTLADAGDTGGFVSEFQELRGDILLAQGKKDEARSAYGKALEGLTKGSSYERVLKMKLADLGPDTTAPQPESIK
jgi:predicted negative regulator of RcsB-dependent stress response